MNPEESERIREMPKIIVENLKESKTAREFERIQKITGDFVKF